MIWIMFLVNIAFNNGFSPCSFHQDVLKKTAPKSKVLSGAIFWKFYIQIQVGLPIQAYLKISTRRPLRLLCIHFGRNEHNPLAAS